MIAKEAKYKKTGIDWMPEIPEHWNIVRLKNVSKIVNGATPKSSVAANWDGNINWITPAEFGNEMYIGESVRKITKTGLKSCAASLVPIGSIILSSRAPIGSLGIANVELCTNQGCRSIVPANVNNYFLYFLLIIQKDNLNVLGNGTTFRELGTDSLKNYKIPLPPKEEQVQIATFLLQEYHKIARFIQTKERFIELLKEQRQSIIEIALKSEENWTKSKIKHTAKMFGRIGFRGYQTSDLVDKGKGAITISPSNMKDNKMDFNQCSYLSWAKYEESPEIKIYQGDILFVKTGATYGKVALVPELPEKATINPQLMVFKELKIDAEYFCYYLQTGYIKEQVEKTVIGGTIPTISQTKVGTFQVYYPNPTEQKRIVEHIKIETRTLDIAISKAEREVELIKEYREAMIAEAVTGKMKFS